MTSGLAATQARQAATTVAGTLIANPGLQLSRTINP